MPCCVRCFVLSAAGPKHPAQQHSFILLLSLQESIGAQNVPKQPRFNLKEILNYYRFMGIFVAQPKCRSTISSKLSKHLV